MLPNFVPGDHVLTFNWVKLKSGDVIVFSKANKKYLKRVKRILGDQILTSGDNQLASVKMGAIDVKEVVGKVILKY